MTFRGSSRAQHRVEIGQEAIADEGEIAGDRRESSAHMDRIENVARTSADARYP
jgi:hypothetical protein